MRVLLLTQVLPYPPDSGPKAKTYYVLKYLAARHQVTLVSFVRDTDKPEHVQYLKSLCERVITVPITRSSRHDVLFLGQSLLTGQPWMMLRDQRQEMKVVLDELVKTTYFDVVHADQSNMAQYALQFKNSRKVLYLHIALWILYKRLAESQPARPLESITERTRTDPSLTVTGYVEDTLPYPRDSSMMVVPLKAGGGMRVKILNALSQGIPMVSTTVGCEGIAVKNGKDIVVADDPRKYADATVRLLTDVALNERITLNGRNIAQRIYDYREACKPLDALYGSKN